MRRVSKRPVTKQAKEQQKGTFPASASPAAVPTMFASAMPISKKRDANFLANASDLVLLDKSASSTTTLGYFSPALTSASPKASRVAFIVAITPSLPERARAAP